MYLLRTVLNDLQHCDHCGITLNIKHSMSVIDGEDL